MEMHYPTMPLSRKEQAKPGNPLRTKSNSGAFLDSCAQYRYFETVTLTQVGWDRGAFLVYRKPWKLPSSKEKVISQVLRS